jgi:biopolymer transport protein ExbB
MLTTILTSGAPKAAAENPYGLMAALREGGLITQSVFGILVIFLFFSLYILFTKWFEQQKVLNQYKRVRATFWGAPSLREGAAKLERNSAYRQLVEDGLAAQDQYGKLTDPVEAHDWMHGSLRRSEDLINSALKGGLSFLATVGSTAPFIGLFGTVIGIYRALIKIGASGDASITTVAGPVGEALIMTALGLVVAVPAVLAYNWLIRRNKTITEDLAAFTNDLHGYLMSAGAVKPTLGGPTTAKTTTARTAEPVRTGRPETTA